MIQFYSKQPPYRFFTAILGKRWNTHGAGEERGHKKVKQVRHGKRMMRVQECDENSNSKITLGFTEGRCKIIHQRYASVSGLTMMFQSASDFRCMSFFACVCGVLPRRFIFFLVFVIHFAFIPNTTFPIGLQMVMNIIFLLSKGLSDFPLVFRCQYWDSKNFFFTRNALLFSFFARNEYDWICFHLRITNGFFALYIRQNLIKTYHQKANAKRATEKPTAEYLCFCRSIVVLVVCTVFRLLLFFSLEELECSFGRASLEPIDGLASWANSMELRSNSPYGYSAGTRQMHYPHYSEINIQI